MTEQRDEQARIRELEGALATAIGVANELHLLVHAKPRDAAYDSQANAAHGRLEHECYPVHNASTSPDSEPQGEVVVTTNERGDAVAVTRQDEEGEILSVIWERDIEPAGGGDHSRDFEGTDPRGMGPLPGEPGNPNPSFEQMERQDAMLERRDCLESVADWLRHQHGLHIAGTDRTIDATEPMEALRQALSRTSDDECANELHRLAKVLGLPDDGPQENVDAAIRRTRSAEREIGFHWRPLLQWAVGTIDQINEGPLTWDEWSEDAGLHEQARQLAFAAPRTSDETMRHALFILRHGESPPEVTREDTIRRLERAIEGCSDEGTGCVVPEAVWRNLHKIEQDAPRPFSECACTIRYELDRAIAEQGGQPEHGESDE